MLPRYVEEVIAKYLLEASRVSREVEEECAAIEGEV